MTEHASFERRSSDVRMGLLTAGGVLLAWAASLFGPATLLAMVLLPVLAVFLIRRRRWVHLGVLAGLSPITAASVLGIASYLRGSAHLMISGMPSLETYNVDPATRLQRVSSGCIVDGSEWVLQTPKNFVVRTLSTAFGPMPGAYDGPFPSEQESVDALASALPVTWESIRAELVPLGKTQVRLRAGLGDGLSALRDAVVLAEPRAALWRDRVLVLDLPAIEPGDAPARRLLVDVRTGKVLAYHGIASALYGRGLPHPWT